MKLQQNLMVPGANLTSYVQAVSSIPILSLEEEKNLSERLFIKLTSRRRVN